MTFELRPCIVIKHPYPQIRPPSNEELAVRMKGRSAFFAEVHGHLEGLEGEEGGGIEEGDLVASADGQDVAHFGGELQVHHGSCLFGLRGQKRTKMSEFIVRSIQKELRR